MSNAHVLSGDGEDSKQTYRCPGWNCTVVNPEGHPAEDHYKNAGHIGVDQIVARQSAESELHSQAGERACKMNIKNVMNITSKVYMDMYAKAVTS